MASENDIDLGQPEPDLVASIYGDIAVPHSGDLIRRFLEAYGEWGYCEALLLGPLLQPKQLVFDIGAFIGTFSLGIAHLGAGQVVAVEANERAVRLLRRNLSALCKAPHQVVPAAVGAAIGAATCVSSDETNLGATSWATVQTGEEPEMSSSRVAQTTLAALRAEFGSYQLVKLDIEGAEGAALLGDADWIGQNKPTIWAECNESIRSLELLETMCSLNLAVMFVAYPSWRRQSFKRPQEEIFPLAYEAALLAGSPESLSRFRADAAGEELIVDRVSDVDHLRELLWRTPRWATKPWPALSRLELVALLGRGQKGERFEEFLRPGRA